jgi:hypothetical protein
MFSRYYVLSVALSQPQLHLVHAAYSSGFLLPMFPADSSSILAYSQSLLVFLIDFCYVFLYVEFVFSFSCNSHQLIGYEYTILLCFW